MLDKLLNRVSYTVSKKFFSHMTKHEFVCGAHCLWDDFNILNISHKQVCST